MLRIGSIGNRDILYPRWDMATNGQTAGPGFPGMRNKEWKEQAVAFYQENKIPAMLEKMLNKMYLAKPTDIYGYMVSEI